MFFNSVCFTIYAKKTIISKKTKYLSAFKQFIHQLDEQYFAELALCVRASFYSGFKEFSNQNYRNAAGSVCSHNKRLFDISCF